MLAVPIEQYLIKFSFSFASITGSIRLMTVSGSLPVLLLVLHCNDIIKILRAHTAACFVVFHSREDATSAADKPFCYYLIILPSK